MTTQNTHVLQDELIQFVRTRDYKLVKELGAGACGRTVLLRDEQIEEYFVCKKYHPYSESQREALFEGFVREVKLLHRLHHRNVVRVFNHYLYPDKLAGYILMEYVDGSNIEEYCKSTPERVNELFLQAVDGFGYLELCGVLHRDIRPANLMVGSDGGLKIIDLGFGKRVKSSADFEKSITLNWWCDTPQEFNEKRYDFSTEVYFVGKLFERVIQESQVGKFKYATALRGMCEYDPSRRIKKFADIDKMIRSDQFSEMEFSEEDKSVYRRFSSAICEQITKIESGATYVSDPDQILAKLLEAYRGLMLEERVPDAGVILRCLIAGSYYYRKVGLRCEYVLDFIKLLKGASVEQKRVIIANLYTKLDAIDRYMDISDDDIPF
jgi:hypothetical protein